ncbi:hypothetical protein BDFB_013893 [Asbolus verrucosus]|uniref:Uncharacterized protein n=1 Tax=Asbolus verrucosus TaxID=1661398 RepID=A0A482VC51_ASBVE|nr:hypothetical protein BDFB_013893 [Asbolus verrucosus]
MSVPDAELQLDPALLDLDLSPIKKERIIKARKQALREKLRADLPVLGVKEIRRFRLPYHEALLAELVESNHESTAEFIKQLLEYQEKIRKRFGPGTVIWLRPQLINSKYQLDTLTKGLTKAENAHNSGDFATECDEMLRLAAQYAFGPDDWWWLGEQLLYQCVSMHYPGNFKRQEAIAYYIIGKYLVENGKKVESGKYYLELARDMSIGKSWNCRKILDAKQDTVFMESCSLLYQALIEEARNLISTDPLKAIEVSLVARKRAAEACNHDGEFEAMIVKGKCELKLKKSTEAIATIMKVLNRAVRKKNIKALCEAKISLALAYLQ